LIVFPWESSGFVALPWLQDRPSVPGTIAEIREFEKRLGIEDQTTKSPDRTVRAKEASLTIYLT
jgi:hypothetical protein